uniref:5' exonuclease Apollo n=1 Tax=Echeneis naucrates TaxID=173247 RepID=A0A665UDJ7_ECHNA
MSVNGEVIPHTPLAVDFWHVRKCPGTRLFFLSHMHSDHTVGLTSTWSGRAICCSATTAGLLRLKLQVNEQWIHPLELSEPHLLPLDDIGEERLTVTLIDANHCPGAVMSLFEGYFGSILYTGLYALGKESLLVELAMEFKTWIEVSFERMETLQALKLPDVFTTDQGAGRIQAVEQSQICCASMHQWNKNQPILAILPTSRPLVSFHPNIHVVPYSDHSSYQELEDFVSALKPTCLVPTIRSCLPGSLSALLPSKKQHEILVPESVQQYMLRQPELKSSARTSLHRRHFRPVAPRGVIFESPVNASKSPCEHVWGTESQDASEEEIDIESSERDTESIVVNISKKLSLNKNRRGAEDTWSLNMVQTVSEDMVMAESVPFSQLTQSNFAPVDILTNTKACLEPIRTVRRPLEMNGEISKPASGENDNDQHIGYGNVENILTVSDNNSMDQQSGKEINQDDNKMSNNYDMSQRPGCEEDQSNSMVLLQDSPEDNFCTSPSPLYDQMEEYVEELENSILKSLPFTKLDFRTWDLLQQSILEQFPLCPLNEADDISDY